MPKIANREAYEWRKEHREEALAQIQKFLERVGRRGSEKSVENAITGVLALSSYAKKLPDEIVKDVKEGGSVYELLDDYVGWLVNECKATPNTTRDRLSMAKKFLRSRDIDVSNDKVRSKVELPRMFTRTRDRAPTPAELRSVLLHTNGRGKTVIAMLASSGMRVGEFLSLRVKDLDFTKSPTTAYLRAEVTKDRQARYCFMSDEATLLLKEFLGERINDKNAYLFPSSTRGQEHDINGPMSYWTVDGILTNALRSAGLEEKDEYGRDMIHVHCLRKFFFSQMVPLLGREVVEALMGHKQFLDASYRRFTEDQMRSFYLKGMNAVTIMIPHNDSEKIKQDAALEAMRAVATTFGLDPMKVKVEKEKEAGREINAEEEMELIKVEIKKLREPQDDPQMIVKEEELQTYLKDGWQFVSVLPSQKILVRK